MKNDYLSFATILLPRPGVDLSRYSVIACDQFTSQPDYWQKVKDYVGSAPSTLQMILPEIYLSRPDAKQRIAQIHRTMKRYQAEGVFSPLPHAMICVRRTLSDGTLRRGIVGLIDLEQYDYRPGSDSLIRATEQTVLSAAPQNGDPSRRSFGAASCDVIGRRRKRAPDPAHLRRVPANGAAV